MRKEIPKILGILMYYVLLILAVIIANLITQQL